MNTTPHRIAVAGASGRMGQMLIEAVATAPDCVLAAALDRPESPVLGKDASQFTGQPVVWPFRPICRHCRARTP